MDYVDLLEWARLQGIYPQTAYRWFRERTLPVPAVRVNSRSVLVAPDPAIAPAPGGIGLYARVSSPDQRADLDRQVARLTAWTAQCGRAVVRPERKPGPG
jgi:putative resolvase